MKKVIKQCLIGAPIGLAFSYVITIVISCLIGEGKYYAVVPEFAADVGSEITAVVLQAVFSMLYGAAFGGASVIWQKDWSLLKMTVIHLIICSAATFPTAYIMYWMPHDVVGILSYFGIFAASYAAIWFGQYSAMKRKLRKINEKVREKS